MLKNYIRIAVRNLIKHKIFSSINILGLAMGMSVALLLGLWIWDEVSFNHYYSNHEKLGEIVSVETFNGMTTAAEYASVPMAAALRNNYPEEFKRLALTRELNAGISAGNKKIGSYGLWAEADFPGMLTLKMEKGNYHNFSDPSSLLMSESLARSLFGNENPVNKLVSLNNAFTMKISGVYEDFPFNTNFYGLDFLCAWNNINNTANTQIDDWSDHHFQLYVQLSNNVTFPVISSKIKDLTKPHIPGSWEELLIHPMDRWHLYTDFIKDGQSQVGRIQFVWLFGIIGVFVLTLACINFMNLSTARSEKRAKEVGIRKTLGSSRNQLIFQFIGESLLFTCCASLIALVSAWLFLPEFNRLSGKQLHLPILELPFWLSFLGFTVFTGLLAGSYPAFFLSAFKSVKVLKGNFKSGKRAFLPRQIMVVVQFTVCSVLIMGTIVVYQQVQFAKSRPLGYSTQRLLSIEMSMESVKDNFEALRNDLLQSGAVENVAESSSPSTEVRNSMMGYSWPGKDPHVTAIVGTLFVSHDFGKTIGWKIIEGRDFSRDFPTDSGAYILNEAATKFTGLKNPVGQIIRWHGTDHPILAVVKDMIMESPYKPAQPTFFTLRDLKLSFITIRLNKTIPVPLALSAIKKIFHQYDPDAENGFDYTFTADNYNLKFSDEQHIGSLSTVFCLLAILISCLGLFGLASYVAEQRTKELAVRKVLGASLASLWTLLSSEFIRLILISCAIAIPVAWYALHNWLRHYVFHTAISGWIFILVSLVTLVIALITISVQILRAALLNPACLLRSE